MVAGELVTEGSPTGIKSGERGQLFELHVDQPQHAADRLKETMDRWRVSLFGDRLHVIVDEDADRGGHDFEQTLACDGIRILSQREARFSLEDVFIKVVEQSRLEGKVAREDG